MERRERETEKKIYKNNAIKSVEVVEKSMSLLLKERKLVDVCVCV